MDGYPGLARSRDSVAQCPEGVRRVAPNTNSLGPGLHLIQEGASVRRRMESVRHPGLGLSLRPALERKQSLGEIVVGHVRAGSQRDGALIMQHRVGVLLTGCREVAHRFPN